MSKSNKIDMEFHGDENPMLLQTVFLVPRSFLDDFIDVFIMNGRQCEVIVKVDEDGNELDGPAVVKVTFSEEELFPEDDHDEDCEMCGKKDKCDDDENGGKQN